MPKKYFIKTEKSFQFEDNIVVDGEEFLHIVNVMRKKVNDEICVIDGSGSDYFCTIIEINKKNLVLKINDIKDCNSETKADVTCFQALVKGDKFELIIQKSTELGVKNFVPFSSEFCQVKPNTTRLDRLEKISVEALKQCGRAKKLAISGIKTFDEMIETLKDFDVVIFAYENSKLNLSEEMLKIDGKFAQKVAIVVGSEGGFSEKEIDKLTNIENIKVISMGNRILRAETAAISLASVVMFLLGEWKVN